MQHSARSGVWRCLLLNVVVVGVDLITHVFLFFSFSSLYRVILGGPHIHNSKSYMEELGMLNRTPGRSGGY